MRTEELEAIFTRQYGAIRFSPLLFGQRGLLNKYLLPARVGLPESDLILTWINFAWGYNSATPGLAALDTQNQVIQIAAPTFVWGLSGYTNDNTGPNGSSQGFLFQLYHTHKSKQIRLFNRHTMNGEALGSFGNPMVLRQPYLFLPGDAIECEVKNLGNPVSPATTSIKLTIFGALVQVQA